ncbi:hypothetical protein ACFVU2_21330, partial [Leifsonia sp. NPDC058194]|uniref:hypothetical protein n=1 Tax=Leifsonia sp. NPDC058194 TaxID=3346374 RepID=UPI0036DED39E
MDHRFAELNSTDPIVLVASLRGYRSEGQHKIVVPVSAISQVDDSPKWGVIDNRTDTFNYLADSLVEASDNDSLSGWIADRGRLELFSVPGSHGPLYYAVGARHRAHMMKAFRITHWPAIVTSGVLLQPGEEVSFIHQYPRTSVEELNAARE